MPRDKIKPPAETKSQLMDEITRLLVNKPMAIEFLLNFFTSADLVGIREELKK
jgi:hypothetical protein